MQKVIILIFCFVVTASMVYGKSQTNSDEQVGSWNILQFKYDVNKKWSCFLEGQVRSLAFYNRWHYNELKTGISFQFNHQIGFTAGFGSFNTYTEGGNFQTPIQREEWRNWQQVVLQQQVGRIKIDHRYRAEQRFTNVGFRNRFRYRLQLLKPLGVENKYLAPFFFYVWDEIFITDKATYFERNRFSVGIGWKVNPKLTVQSGWVRQFDYNLKDELGRNFFQVSFAFNFKAKTENSLPENQLID